MRRITSLKDANQVLQHYVPAARQYREAVVSLQSMQTLMRALGNPQDKLKVIHTAGSSGKTSTAYFVTSLLVQAGKTVGLTVSPHIDEVNERVQVNLHPLPEEIFCAELQTFLNLVEAAGSKPTYFELLVAFAYWYFAKIEVDYAVVEVGLGGLLDATNVIHNRSKICVITDIGLDHTELLGKTLPEITSQKAGIVGEYNSVFCYQQDEEVMEVIREVARQKNAALHEIIAVNEQDLANLPLFQQRNWYLAYQVYDFLAKRDNLTTLTNERLLASTEVYIPARMEVVTYQGKTLIMDGAHNPQKMAALVRSLRRQYPKEQFAVVVSLLKGKKHRSMGTLRQLTSLANHLIVTTFDTRQDMRKQSLHPLKTVAYLEELGFDDWEIEREAQKAFDKLLARPEKMLLVTGSFYLLNHIRPLIGVASDTPDRRNRQ